MERSNGDGGDVAGTPSPDGEALEFVRFCHRRKHVGWPELYDEMCAVAGRGLYRGYGPEELNEIGIGFGLFQMPALAGLVGRVVAEDRERRQRTADAIRAATVVPAPHEESAVVAQATQPPAEASPLGVRTRPDPADRAAPDHGSIRIAVAAGA